MTELDGKSPLTAVEKPVDSTADGRDTFINKRRISRPEHRRWSKTSTDVTPSDTVRFLTR